MQTILDLYEAAGRRETTIEAINAADLASMSKAELVHVAAAVSVYTGGKNKTALTAAIRERLLARLLRSERTSYGSEAL